MLPVSDDGRAHNVPAAGSSQRVHGGEDWNCVTMSNQGTFSMPEERSVFPLMVKLQGRKCVVVGGGKIAASKAAGLLAHGARVVVISPDAAPAIQRQARAGVLIWRQRRFSPKDVNRAFLVIAATDSVITNEAVFRACRARRVLCNAVDDPERCDFFYPAVVRRGSLLIAISTNGRSPALAARLRRELERQFGPEWSAWVEHLGKLRRDVLGRGQSAGNRRLHLAQMVSSRAFGRFVREQRENAGKTKPARRKG
jgi:precorrin-2 dehydrogenase/sirohydrochlorin ferrochelatase